MIAIIDYDAGNIKSVEKALLSLGQEVTVTAKQDEILGADKIVFTGGRRVWRRYGESEKATT